jgi:hypothetical protein
LKKDSNFRSSRTKKQDKPLIFEKKKKKKKKSEMSVERPPPPLPADDNVVASALSPRGSNGNSKNGPSSEAQELRALQLGVALPSGWSTTTSSTTSTTSTTTKIGTSNSSTPNESPRNHTTSTTTTKEKHHQHNKATTKAATLSVSEARRASTPHHIHHSPPPTTLAPAEPRRASSSDTRATRPIDAKPPAKKAPSPLSASPEKGALIAKHGSKSSGLDLSKSDGQVVRKVSGMAGAQASASAANGGTKMIKAVSTGSVKWTAKQPRARVRTQFAVVLADQRQPITVRRTVAMDDGWDIVAPSETAKIAAQAAPVVVSPRNAALVDFVIVSVSVPSCQTVKKLKFSPWQTVADAQDVVVKALRRAGSSFPLSDEAAKRFRMCTVSVLPGASWGAAGELPGIPLALDPKRTLADCGIKTMSHVAFVAFDEQAGSAGTKPVKPAPAPTPAQAAPKGPQSAAPPAPAPQPTKAAPALPAAPAASTTGAPSTSAPARPALPPATRRVSVSSDDSNSGSNISMTDDDEEENDNNDNDDDDDEDEDDSEPLPAPSSTKAAAVVDGPLPDGWEKLTDATGRVYFASMVDGKSLWQRPTVAVLPPLRDGWEQHTDPSTGRVFFEHTKSGKTDWIRPGLDEWKAMVLNKKLDHVTWLAVAGETTHKWEQKNNNGMKR